MIGNKIKNIRELKNLKQSYMAEQLHISQAAYSKLEKGGIKVSTEKLSQIAEILHVKIEDIISFDKEKYLDKYSDTASNIPDENTIIQPTEVQLINKLYEDKILLLEKLLSKSEKELNKYKTKYGEF